MYEWLVAGTAIAGTQIALTADFFRRRATFPLSARSPVLTCFVALSWLAWYCLSWLFLADVLSDCGIRSILSNAFFITFTQGYIVRMIQILFRVNIEREMKTGGRRLSISSMQHFEKSEKSIERWYCQHRHWVSDGKLLLIFSITTMVFVTVHLGSMYGWQGTDLCAFHFGRDAPIRLINILQALLFGFFAWNLRRMRESMSLKSEVTGVALLICALLLSALVITPFAGLHAAAICFFACEVFGFCLIIVWPLWLSYRNERQLSSRQAANSNQRGIRRIDSLLPLALLGAERHSKHKQVIRNKKKKKKRTKAKQHRGQFLQRSAGSAGRNSSGLSLQRAKTLLPHQEHPSELYRWLLGRFYREHLEGGGDSFASAAQTCSSSSSSSPVSGIAVWPHDPLESLLRNTRARSMLRSLAKQDGHDAFAELCEREFSSENLLFCDAIVAFWHDLDRLSEKSSQDSWSDEDLLASDGDSSGDEDNDEEDVKEEDSQEEEEEEEEAKQKGEGLDSSTATRERSPAVLLAQSASASASVSASASTLASSTLPEPASSSNSNSLNPASAPRSIEDLLEVRAAASEAQRTKLEQEAEQRRIASGLACARVPVPAAALSAQQRLACSHAVWLCKEFVGEKAPLQINVPSGVASATHRFVQALAAAGTTTATVATGPGGSAADRSRPCSALWLSAQGVSLLPTAAGAPAAAAQVPITVNVASKPDLSVSTHSLSLPSPSSAKHVALEMASFPPPASSASQQQQQQQLWASLGLSADASSYEERCRMAFSRAWKEVVQLMSSDTWARFERSVGDNKPQCANKAFALPTNLAAGQPT